MNSVLLTHAFRVFCLMTEINLYWKTLYPLANRFLRPGVVGILRLYMIFILLAQVEAL